MSYLTALIWYSVWGVVIVAGYYASAWAIRYFDRKWKDVTEAEEKASQN